MNRFTVICWTISYILIALSYGSIYGEIQTFLTSNELLTEMFTQSGVSIEASFTQVILLVIMSLISIMPVVIIHKLYKEEASSRLSVLFTRGISRFKILCTTIIFALISSFISMILAILILGTLALSMMEDDGKLTLMSFVAAGLNFYVVVIFISSLAVCLLGVLPRFIWLVYGFIAYCFFMNYFNTLLNIPDEMMATALYSILGQMPVETFDIHTYLMILLFSVIFICIGCYQYLRRDLI